MAGRANDPGPFDPVDKSDPGESSSSFLEEASSTQDMAESLDVTGYSESVPDEDTSPEIEEARAEIEQTRAEMSETIDAIQEKLSPENLTEQAKDTIRQATVGKIEETVTAASDRAAQTVSSASGTITGAASTAGKSIQDRTMAAGFGGRKSVQRLLPFVAASGLLALLIVQRRRRTSQKREMQAARSRVGAQALDQFRQKVGKVSEQVRERAGQRDKADQARDRAGQARQKAMQIRDRMIEIAGRQQEPASAPVRQNQAQEAVQRFSELLADSPVAAVDVIAALGVVAALTALRRARRSSSL